MSSQDKQTSALKIQVGRFKRLLDDVKYYEKEIAEFEKKYEDIVNGEQTEETAFKQRHLQNQREETLLAIQNSISRAEAALGDLYVALTTYPEDRRSADYFINAIEVYKRASEVDLSIDEDFIQEVLKTSTQ